MKKLLLPVLLLMIGSSSYAMEDPLAIIERVKSGIKPKEIQRRRSDDGMMEFFVEKEDVYICYSKGCTIVKLAGKSITVQPDFAQSFLYDAIDCSYYARAGGEGFEEILKKDERDERKEVEKKISSINPAQIKSNEMASLTIYWVNPVLKGDHDRHPIISSTYDYTIYSSGEEYSRVDGERLYPSSCQILQTKYEQYQAELSEKDRK